MVPSGMAIDTSATRQMLERDKFIAELKTMFNDICIIYDDELVRLVGFYEDEMDFYYHVKNGKGEPRYCSAVGHLVSLKGIYPEANYQRLDDGWHMNHCQRETAFVVGGGPEVKADFGNWVT
jgi:hypothetical protein